MRLIAATHWSRPMLAGPQNGSQRSEFGGRGRETAKWGGGRPERPRCSRHLEAESGAEPLSCEPKLLARGRRMRRDVNSALEHLRPEEGLHQLVVETVPDHLRLDANSGGVLGRLGGPLARQPAFEDPLGGPPVDGV